MLQRFVLAVLLLCPTAIFANDDSTESLIPEDEEIVVWDPFEGMNRGIFWINDTLDVHILEPVAQSYQDNFSDKVRTSLGNFYENIRTPVYVVSNLAQFRVSGAVKESARFLLNSTLGVLGFFDPATKLGLKSTEDDFGIALGRQGVGPGPYIVIPFLGPSNLRDAFGRAVDAAIVPVNYVGSAGVPDTEALWAQVGYRVATGIHDRASVLEAIKAGKESAVDYYLFAQTAYTQYRQGKIEEK